MSKHTAGPWKVVETANDNMSSLGHRSATVRDADNKTALIYWQGSATVTNFNAALIAAAPELLTMLEGLLGTAEAVNIGNANMHKDYCGFDQALFDKCRAAIAKATQS
jgi:hypothetical protein